MAAVLLAVGDKTALTAGDSAIQSLITGAGHTVTLMSDEEAIPAGTFDAVVLTQTGTSANYGTKFTALSIGVLTLNTGGMLSQLKLASTNTGTLSGVSTQFDQLNSTHPISSGLPDPSTVFTTSQANIGVVAANMAAGVTALYASMADVTRVCVGAAEAAATATSGTFAGRRAFIGFPDSGAANLASSGRTLFGQALVWVLGTPANPPTVSAGPDLTEETGGPAFTITGTATPAGGATISSRAWAQLSGPTTAMSGTATATVSITPPSTTGTAVYQFTATDSNGQSASDTVSVTYVVPGQSMRPLGDVSLGGWTSSPTTTPIAATLDETTADASDYVSSSDTPTGDIYVASLTPGADPGTDSGHVVEVQVWRDAAVTSHSLQVELLQGASTVVKSVTFTDLTATPTVRQIALTTGEAALITDYSNLRLRFTATAA